ncbi:hypothetical protein TRVL_06255 [Trypanosoma vivax]|nr:hypothetical protein TRVL_06255 [Trypanosoma vivax]
MFQFIARLASCARLSALSTLVAQMCFLMTAVIHVQAHRVRCFPGRFSDFPVLVISPWILPCFPAAFISSRFLPIANKSTSLFPARRVHLSPFPVETSLPHTVLGTLSELVICSMLGDSDRPHARFTCDCQTILHASVMGAPPRSQVSRKSPLQ